MGDHRQLKVEIKLDRGKFLSWMSHIIPMCIVSGLWSCAVVAMSAMIEGWVKESGQRGYENHHVSVPDLSV